MNFTYMKLHGYVSILIPILLVSLNGCSSNTGHKPSTPSINCEVLSGPNKGKKGTRTEDGWCSGDWGGTECTPPSKCKDIPAEGGDNLMEVDPKKDVIIAQGRSAIVSIVPARGSLIDDYCQTQDNKLSVVFVNTGDLSSSDRTTKVNVDFTTGSTNVIETQLMPSIPPGGTIEMIFEVPSRCFFSHDCLFSIQWSNQPVVFGRCLG